MEEYLKELKNNYEFLGDSNKIIALQIDLEGFKK